VILELVTDLFSQEWLGEVFREHMGEGEKVEAKATGEEGKKQDSPEESTLGREGGLT
jgi:hypothetical protein